MKIGFLMAKCLQETINFSPLNGKNITGSFTGGSITSDGGLMLLREVDKKLQLTNKITKSIIDKRDSAYITHPDLKMQLTGKMVYDYLNCWWRNLLQATKHRPKN